MLLILRAAQWHKIPPESKGVKRSLTLLYFAIFANFFLYFKRRRRLFLSMMHARSGQIVTPMTSDLGVKRYEALPAFFLAGCGAESGWADDAA
jgi:hypothetical protein